MKGWAFTATAPGEEQGVHQKFAVLTRDDELKS